MAVVQDVLLRVVRRVLKVELRSVPHTEVANDALIVLLGLILDRAQNSMMDIVRLVLSNSFQMTNEVRVYIYIRKKSVFVIPSMRILKDLYMTSHCIRVNVIAR